MGNGVPPLRWMTPLIPPDLRRSPDLRRRAEVLWGAALGSSLAAIGLSLVRLGAEGPSPVVIAIIVASIAFLWVPALMWLTRSTKIAGIWMVLVPWAALSAMIVLEQSLASDGVLWMPVVPLVASFFLGPGGAWIFAGLCSLTLIAAGWAHSSGAWAPFPGLLLPRVGAAVTGAGFGAYMGWLWERTRLAAELALARSSAHNRALLDGLPDTLVVLRPNGEIVQVQSARGQSALFPADAPRHRLADLLPGGAARSLVKQARRTQEVQEITRADHLFLRSFDQAALTVEARMVPLGDELVTLLRDVTELRQADKLKDDFISTVSHELRTPLTSIVGAVKLLGSGLGGDLSPKGADLVEMAERNGQRLITLLNDLLDVQKIAAGRLELELSLHELGPLVARCIESDLAYAAEHSVDIFFDQLPARLFVEADEGRFQQIISNLVSNAVKYSPRGEQVRVRCLEVEGRGRVEIQDHGPGIPELFRPFVFERFAQAKEAPTQRKTASSGLGLAITRQLVELHGGKIGFETELKVGTTFFVELPLVPQGPTPK